MAKIRIKIENRTTIIVETVKAGSVHTDYAILPMLNAGVAHSKAMDLANVLGAEPVDKNTWETNNG